MVRENGFLLSPLQSQTRQPALLENRIRKRGAQGAIRTNAVTARLDAGRRCRENEPNELGPHKKLQLWPLVTTGLLPDSPRRYLFSQVRP